MNLQLGFNLCSFTSKPLHSARQVGFAFDPIHLPPTLFKDAFGSPGMRRSCDNREIDSAVMIVFSQDYFFRIL